MTAYAAVIERCPETGLLVGYAPGIAGAYTQADTLDDLQTNPKEALSLILEDGEPKVESQFVGPQMVFA